MMLNKTQKTIIVVAVIFIAGCESGGSTNRGSKSRINRAFLDSFIAGKEKVMYVTKVISDPPGARIELDDDYIGDAPLEIEWEGWSNNELFVRDHELRALPIYQGQYTQYKRFEGSTISKRYADTVPKTIFFDMTLHPMPQQYEIDID